MTVMLWLMTSTNCSSNNQSDSDINPYQAANQRFLAKWVIWFDLPLDYWDSNIKRRGRVLPNGQDDTSDIESGFSEHV